MYLIVITRKKKVGEILGHAVWKVVDFDMISYKKSVLHLSETQVRVAASLKPSSDMLLSCVMLVPAQQSSVK